MDTDQALVAFSSLAQSVRLRIVRRRVAGGQVGLYPGVLAEAAGVSSSNLSFHLSHLERAGPMEFLVRKGGTDQPRLHAPTACVAHLAESADPCPR